MRRLQNGERIDLVDKKGRQYALTLKAGEVFQYSGETISHDALIGQPDGALITLSRGKRMIALLPTLGEYVLKMPRGAQVIYPKDLAIVAMWADVYPGARVFEAGTGSGALTMALLRAGGVYLSYVPTVPQVMQTVEALERAGGFGLIQTFETLLRTWNIQGRSVRPDHRMVAHSGFITVARRVEPGLWAGGSPGTAP